MNRALRMPLQTGVTSAKEAAFALIPLCALTALLVFGISSRNPLPVIFSVPWLGASLFMLRRSYRRRASDVVFGNEGLTFEGGPLDGRLVRWTDIDPSACGIQTNRGESISIGSETTYLNKLVLGMRDGSSIVAGESLDEQEQRSFAALLDSIRAALDARWARPNPAAPMNPTVVTCSGCGAAVMPDDLPVVVCGYCGRQMALPEHVRQVVRQQRQLAMVRSGRGQLIARILRQPGAHRINVLLAVVAVVVGISVGAVHYLGLGAVVLGMTIFFLVRLVVDDRRALRTFMLDFAAGPPRQQGAPPTCRRCGAPLPLVANTDVVECAYCRAENILGIDLARATAAARVEHRELEQALLLRNEARNKNAVAAIACVLLGGILLGSKGSANRAASKTDMASPPAATSARSEASSSPLPPASTSRRSASAPNASSAQ